MDIDIKELVRKLDPEQHCNHKYFVAQIEKALLEARLDEIDTAITMTQQSWSTKSPFANIENIEANIMASTARYLLVRKAQLKEIQ